MEPVRDYVAVSTWTTVTTSLDTHADKMRMRKNVCADGALFTTSTDTTEFFLEEINRQVP